MDMKTETSDWDASEYLDSPEMIKEYINAAIEEGNPELLQAALGDIAKAKGMTDIAKKAKVSRQNLYKTFSAGNHPRLDTIQKVIHSLGLKLKVETL
jgi:probable addiction module antidote protein